MNKFTWESLFSLKEKYQDYQFPKVTIVVPTFNCSEKISLTIESILSQEYPDFELIMIDSGSTDRTLEVIKYHKDVRMRVYSVPNYQRYEMLNRGIFQATGIYINFLFPGDFYISKRTLKEMMELALDHHQPDLVYCGTSLREGHTDPKILYRPLTKELLKHGQQPTSLQACWFLVDTVKKLGKFDTNYVIRGGYDLLCKLKLHPDLKVVSMNRILTDYDLRYVTLEMVIDHFKETFRTVFKHFGFGATLKWLWVQKDINRIFRLWFRSVKTAFLGN